MTGCQGVGVWQRFRKHFFAFSPAPPLQAFSIRTRVYWLGIVRHDPLAAGLVWVKRYHIMSRIRFVTHWIPSI